MSTGYGWEGICAMLGARHVPAERFCGGSVYSWRYNKCSTFTFFKENFERRNIMVIGCGVFTTDRRNFRDVVAATM